MIQESKPKRLSLNAVMLTWQVVLATAGYDHTIRFWEATTGICYRTLQYSDSQARFLSVRCLHALINRLHVQSHLIAILNKLLCAVSTTMWHAQSSMALNLECCWSLCR